MISSGGGGGAMPIQPNIGTQAPAQHQRSRSPTREKITGTGTKSDHGAFLKETVFSAFLFFSHVCTAQGRYLEGQGGLTWSSV